MDQERSTARATALRCVLCLLDFKDAETRVVTSSGTEYHVSCFTLLTTGHGLPESYLRVP